MCIRDSYKLAVRLTPPGMPVNIGSLDGLLADQARMVVARMSEGLISPEQANTIMQVLTAQARVIEIDDIERRLRALEEKNNGKA